MEKDSVQNTYDVARKCQLELSFSICPSSSPLKREREKEWESWNSVLTPDDIFDR